MLVFAAFEKLQLSSCPTWKEIEIKQKVRAICQTWQLQLHLNIESKLSTLENAKKNSKMAAEHFNVIILYKTHTVLSFVRQRFSPSVKIDVMDGGKLSLKCKKRLEILNPIHLASTFFPLGRIKYSRYTFAKQES